MADPKDIDDADVIQLNVSTYITTPPELVGPFPSPQLWSRWLCIQKAPGNSFTIDSASGLGLPSDLSFPVTFVGGPIPAGPADPPLYEWTVNEQVNRDFIVGGKSVHVDSLEGTAMSELVNTPNFHGTACDGTPASFKSEFGWVKVGIPPLKDLTLHLTVDDAKFEVPIAFSILQGFLGIRIKPPIRLPWEGQLPMIILTAGALTDAGGTGTGVGKGPVPIPKGPLPFDHALDDALLGLATSKLALCFHNDQAKLAVQRAAHTAVMGALHQLDETISG
jgi:hypothetical protein